MTFAEYLGQITSVIPSRETAAILLLAIAAKTATAMIKGGAELRHRYWPGVTAVSVAMIWVLVSPLIPETVDGWLPVAVLVAGLIATTHRPRSFPSSEGSIRVIRRVALGAAALATFMILFRLGAYSGSLMTWEPEVVEGFLQAFRDRTPWWTFATQRLSWGYGLVSTGWDSLLYGSATYFLFSCVGASTLTLRLPAAVFALATLPALALLGRQAGGRTVGLLTVAVAALQPTFILYGRYGVALSATVLPVTLAIVACVVIADGRSVRAPFGVVAAFSIALATYGYSTGRLAALTLVGLTVVLVFLSPARLNRRRILTVVTLLACLSGFAVLQRTQGSLRLFLDARGEQLLTMKRDFQVEHREGIESGEGFGGRVERASRILKTTVPEGVAVLGRPFSSRPSSHTVVHQDPPLAPFYFAPLLPFLGWGLVTSIRKWKEACHTLLLGVALSSTLPILLTTRADAHRMLLVTIPVAVWIAMGLREAAAIARDCGLSRRYLAVAGVLLMALAVLRDVSLLYPEPHPIAALKPTVIDQIRTEDGLVILGIVDGHRLAGELSLAEMAGRPIAEPSRLRFIPTNLIRQPTAPTMSPVIVRRLSSMARHGTLLLAPQDRFEHLVKPLQDCGATVAPVGAGSNGLWRVSFPP